MLENALLEPVTELAGVLFALDTDLLQETDLTPLAGHGYLAGSNAAARKASQKYRKAATRVGQRQRLLEIDLVIVRRPRVGRRGIQPPDLPVRDDRPGCGLCFEFRHDPRARIVVRTARVSLGSLGVDSRPQE